MLSNPAPRTKALLENIQLFKEYHLKYPSHGYRWLNAKIRLDKGIEMSDPYAHKCCKAAGIKSKAKHYKYKKPGAPFKFFPNLFMSEIRLEDLLEIKKQHPEYQMILHSDQGSVYASKAFNDLLPMYVTRSMSRAGTPTDNSAMESINGWIKAELFMDFHVTGERPVHEEVDEYIKFFNEERPAYALSYLTPKQYREKYSA